MTRGYKDMPADLQNSPHHWLLDQKDFCTLYWQFSTLLGVPIRQAAQVNIHHWLDPALPQYCAKLANAVFLYKKRAEKEDRLKICISTAEMRDVAWKYGHDSQVIVDGTFGLCDHRMLLWIVMGIDEKRKGVPLAFMLFSAPAGNRQTSAGYNAEILEELLCKWRDSLTKGRGKDFAPRVAITDTDLLERKALATVFPKVWLLLCKFHICQSWRNHRNRGIKGKTPAHATVKLRMSRLEQELLTTTTLPAAHAAIAHERVVMEGLLDEAPQLAKNALAHLTYLSEYWLSELLWESWLDYGRQKAATILGCPIEGVLPTTNHLESFNGLLKNKHLRCWQRGGRRLRVDVLVKLLVHQILPSIFAQRRLVASEHRRCEDLVERIPGGVQVVDVWNGAKASAAAVVPTCFLVPDEIRDRKARLLAEGKQVSTPKWTKGGLRFNCYSDLALDHKTTAIAYNIYLGFDGSGSCTCGDFANNGGACKHIRAALLQVDALCAAGVVLPSIPINHDFSKTIAPLEAAASYVNEVVRLPDELYEEGDQLNQDNDKGEHVCNCSQQI
jgi:hypothetical protein